MRGLRIIKDGNEVPVAGINQSSMIYNAVLAANTAMQYTVPTGAKYVNFSPSSGIIDLFMKLTGTAIAVPVSDITDGTGVQVNPGLTDLRGATYISLIATGAGIVEMSFFG